MTLRVSVCCLLVLLPALFRAWPLHAQVDLESPAAESPAVAVDLPLLFEGRNLGMVPCKTSEDGTRIDAIGVAVLDGLVKGILVPGWLDPSILAQEYATLDELAQSGLGFTFDQAELLLELTVPLAMRALEQVRVLGTDNSHELPGLGQALFSAYLNVFATQRFGYNLAVPDVFSWSGTYDLEAVFNLGGWVLEARDAIHTQSGPELPELSLVKEWADSGLVLKAGDYNFNSRSFLEYGSWQGIMAEKSGRHGYGGTGTGDELALDEPAVVEVYVNGQKIRTLHLEGGRYKLSGFGIGNGINLVELKIRTASGKEHAVRTVLPEESTGLAVGEDEFAYAAGIPAWDPSNVVVSAWHAYGFAPWLTGGLGARVSLTQADAAMGLLFPTPAGTFSLDGAFRIPGYDPALAGLALRAGWSFRNNSDPWIPVVGLGWAWTDPAFSETDGTKALAMDMWTSISQHLGPGLGATVRLGWQTFHDGSADSVGLGLTLNAALAPSADLSIRFSTSLTEPSIENSVASLQFQIHDPGSAITFSAAQDLIQAGTRLDLQQSSTRDGIDASLTAQGPSMDTPYGFSLDSALHGSGDRFVASAGLGMISTDTSLGLLEMNGSIALGTAVVFAGEYLSLSRPISDSFALVVPRYDLAEKKLGVNFNGVTHESTSDLLGFPVVSRIASNTPKRLEIEVLDPQDPVFVRGGQVLLAPGYRSGTLVYVGAEPEILVTARLLDAYGKPLAFVAGEVSGSSGSVPFFTDGTGLAIMYGLTAGTWYVHLDGFRDLELVLDADSGTAVEVSLKCTALEGERP